jgi:3-phosphoglycerate kinase
MKTLKEVSVTNKRILVRCDFNVPLDKKGNILDDFRISQSLPTIKYLIENQAKIILMSHLGEPEGQIIPELKLDKVTERLSEMLDCRVAKADDCIGPEIESAANSLECGEILMLENLRFHKEETDSDPEFAKKLSYLGNIFVNDAFGVCHRKNASVSLVPQLMESCAGLLLEKEIESLNKTIVNPERPMIAVIGGKKVETKSKFINAISKVADFVIISGLLAKEVLEKNIKFEYPDKVLSPLGDLEALDINQETIKVFSERIIQAKTVLWNGPFGKCEERKYAKGTKAIADAIIKSGAYSVVGGGETVEFLDQQGIIHEFSHVSTGGGAMMDYISGEKLPGIEALNN